MEVSGAQFMSVPVPLPPLAEQRAIADFLDEQTSKIDTLIAKQTQLVTTLRERRTAVIEGSVLGGLDLERPRVPPPVQWLPPAPATWTWPQLGFVAETLAGYAFPSDGFESSTDFTRLARGVNIKPGRMDWAETVYWDEISLPVPPVYRLRQGDLVLGMDRPFIASGARVAQVEAADLPALLLQRVMRLRAGSRMDQTYMGLTLSTQAFAAYVEPLFTGVSVPHMSEWQVRKFVLPLPPLAEQLEIVAHVSEQTSRIDALLAKTKEHVTLAQERRAALICAAVTGQIDVRTAGHAARGMA